MSQQAGRAALAAAALILIAVQLAAYARLPADIPFRHWHDQRLTLQAARAWVRGDLNPDLHHYPAGYALLAVPFLSLPARQPFLLPDIAASLAALLVFARLALRLGAGPLAAAAAFLLAVLGTRGLAAAWTDPWSSTPAAPLLLATLLFALRWHERARPLDALAAGLCAGLAAWFRPADAAILLAVVVPWMLAARPTAWRHLASLAAGAAFGALPLLLTHTLVFGLGPGAYLAKSQSFGFAPALLPLRWASIVVCPRPLFPDGHGILEALPWLLPALAGALAGLLAPGHRRATALVTAAIAAHWALYLSYRDLHAPALWRFGNIHYFKYTFPFLPLLAWRWAVHAIRRPGLGAATLACAALALCWRADLQPIGADPEPPSGPDWQLPGGLAPANAAFLLPATGSWDAIFLGNASLREAGARFTDRHDFHLFPIAGGVLLLPLRPLPAGDATLTPGTGVARTAGPVWRARTRVAFGIPCILRRCQATRVP